MPPGGCSAPPLLQHSRVDVAHRHAPAPPLVSTILHGSSAGARRRAGSRSGAAGIILGHTAQHAEGHVAGAASDIQVLHAGERVQLGHKPGQEAGESARRKLLSLVVQHVIQQRPTGVFPSKGPAVRRQQLCTIYLSFQSRCSPALIKSFIRS